MGVSIYQLFFTEMATTWNKWQESYVKVYNDTNKRIAAITGGAPPPDMTQGQLDKATEVRTKIETIEASLKKIVSDFKKMAPMGTSVYTTDYKTQGIVHTYYDGLDLGDVLVATPDYKTKVISVLEMGIADRRTLFQLHDHVCFDIDGVAATGEVVSVPRAFAQVLYAIKPDEWGVHGHHFYRPGCELATKLVDLTGQEEGEVRDADMY